MDLKRYLTSIPLIVVNICVFIYLVFISKYADSQQAKSTNQEYSIQIKNDWIETIKFKSSRFGLKYKRKLVSNVHLFEEDGEPPTEYSALESNIDDFKAFFAEKIINVEKRVNLAVKYYPWTDSTHNVPRTQFGRFLLRQRRSAKDEKCWPYYGMGVQEAWALDYTGKGVRVAVVDLGVEIGHPDLKRNIDMDCSYSFVDTNHSDVNPKRFNSYWETDQITSHGTMAAGLIAGEFGNAHCSAGTAFDAKLAALKVFNLDDNPMMWARGYEFSTEHITAAFTHRRDDIDIYSCSFNLDNKFKNASLDIRTALEEGVEKGRKGRGNIFVFSSGNNKGHVYDCNMEALASSIYTITISSVGLNGSKPAHAKPCASTLASTYGEFNTHDGHKLLESTSHDGTCNYFKGTSASAALASGIFALTLQANPNLTWRDMQYITIKTSSFQALKETGRLKRNSAGLYYDPYFGFGLMNATAMAKMAETWKTVPPQKHQTINETNTKTRFISNNTIGLSFRFDNCTDEDVCIRYLEHVQVRIHYKTRREPFLGIILCSPSKTCSYLLNRKTNIKHAKTRKRFVKRNWSFPSVHFWGENPIGQWLLFFRDNDDSKFKEANIENFHEIQSAVLTVFGTSLDSLKPNNNATTLTIQTDFDLLNMYEYYMKELEKVFKETSVEGVLDYVEEEAKDPSSVPLWLIICIICFGFSILSFTLCFIIDLSRKYHNIRKQEIWLSQ